VDGETLGSLILALFIIGCAQLDASLLDLIIFMIAFQCGNVENSLRLSVYEHKLVLRAVESNYKGVGFLVVALNRPGVQKRQLSSVIKPFDLVD